MSNSCQHLSFMYTVNIDNSSVIGHYVRSRQHLSSTDFVHIDNSSGFETVDNIIIDVHI
jgi:hypothetical protein